MDAINPKKLSHISVRVKTARLVLRGSLGIFGVSLVLYVYVLIPLLLNPPDRPIQWANLWGLLGMAATTAVALYLIKKSLAAGMWLYVGGASIFLLIMILGVYFSGGDRTFPFSVYGFHLGILALGLILGFKAGVIYTLPVILVTIGLGVLCQDTGGNTYVAVAFAFGMSLPSLIVDLLEKELKRTEAKFSIIFQESLDVSLVVDEADGQILDANRATRATLGYEGSALITQSVAQLFPPDASLSPTQLLQSLQTQEAIFGSQMFRRADGTLCPMDLTATRVPWEEGQAVLLTLRDVTTRKQAEEELRQHREHLEELVVARTAELQARNAELDAFAHTVAHDLKNPLATLIGFTELLNTQYEPAEPEKRQLIVNAIAQSGRKMINIIDELLLFASVRRAEDVSTAEIFMEQVVKEALQRMTDLVTERQPEIVTPERWPPVWGHAAWIEEVWGNYISNAIKYGGRPAEHIPPRIELGYDFLDAGLPMENSKSQTPKSKVRFWVRDNGRGLTQEEQARLFTPLTQHQVRAKGYGLGLSIVKRIVEKCGGEVGVESIIGQGSTFYFTLPTAPTSQGKQPEKLFI